MKEYDVNFPKLDIRVCPYTMEGRIKNSVIHYKIRQQDNTFVEMTCRANQSMKRFVEYIQIHD